MVFFSDGFFLAGAGFAMFWKLTEVGLFIKGVAPSMKHLHAFA